MDILLAQKRYIIFPVCRMSLLGLVKLIQISNLPTPKIGTTAGLGGWWVGLRKFSVFSRIG